MHLKHIVKACLFVVISSVVVISVIEVSTVRPSRVLTHERCPETTSLNDNFKVNHVEPKSHTDAYENTTDHESSNLNETSFTVGKPGDTDVLSYVGTNYNMFKRANVPRNQKIDNKRHMDNVETCSSYTMPDNIKEWFGNKEIPFTIHKDYIRQPLNLCPTGAAVDYLIVVHSAVDNVDSRQGIRQTFGRQDMFTHVTSRLVFILGTSTTRAVRAWLEVEADLNNDIVQGDFIDAYVNTTLKAATGVRWVAENCPLTKLVIKLDDDVFLQVFGVVEHMIPAMSKRTRHISCSYEPAGVKRLWRSGTWPVPDNEFPNLTHYPVQHCQGWAVFYTGDLICPLYSAAKVVPSFWVDDIYLYGLLPYTVGNVTFESIEKHSMALIVEIGMECLNTAKINCKYLATLNHQYTAKRDKWFFTSLWSNITNNMTLQQSKYFKWQNI